MTGENMAMKHKQQGMTAIAWVIVLALVAIQAVMALRIIPVYMNYGTVKSILDDMAADSELRGESPTIIKSLVQRKLQVNNVMELQRDKNAFKYKKLSDGLQISLNYEARGPIYGNLEFIATFSHEVLIPKK